MKNAMSISVGLFFFTFLPLFAQWEPDQRLTFTDSMLTTSQNYARSIAAAGDYVHVVWWDKRDGNYEIYYKRSTDGGTTWEADIRLTNNVAPSYIPSIAVVDSNVHVVWYDVRSGDDEIYYKHSSNGGTTWGSDIRLTNAPESSNAPSLAVNNSLIHVTWCDWRDGDAEIYYKRSTDNGISWGPDIRLTNSAGNSAIPSVATSDSNVYVVWVDDRDAGSFEEEIYFKYSTDNGVNWSSDIRLTNNAGRSAYPTLGVYGSNIHVVWEDWRDGVSQEVYYKRSTNAGSTWSSDIRLSDFPDASNLPSIAVSGINVHVVWYDSRDGNQEIYYKVSTDNGASWGPDTRLTNALGISYYPSIAISGSNVHVVWSDARDDPRYEVYYKRNPTGNIGIVEKANVKCEKSKVDLEATPNPFTYHTTIPGYKSEKFVVYDITGNVVNYCSGNQIGIGLPAGIYFVMPEDRSAPPVRVVKVK